MSTVNEGSPGLDAPDRETDPKSVWDPMNYLEMFPDNGIVPGPDAMRVKQPENTPLAVVTRVFNILLYVGKLPAYLQKSRTTLIPKKQKPGSPSHCRPIRVSSVLTTLNKIIANRLSAVVPLDERQKVPRGIDGCLSKNKKVYIRIAPVYIPYISVYDPCTIV